MDASTLAAISGLVLSLVFSYVPKLNEWWEALETRQKRLYTAGLMLLVAGAAVGLACSGFGADFGLAITCDRAGVVGVVKAFIAALVANQAAFVVTKG
jgi:hypothetical protein